MFIDNNAFNQPIVFEHKERIPYLILILDLLLVLGFLIMLVAYVCLIFLLSSGYVFTKSQQNIFIISVVIFCCFDLFLAILNGYYERFNFYYIVTFDEDNFFISISIRSSIQTLQFPRKVSYKFKDKSRLVYIRDVSGIKYAFRYNENFRRFLEEIQII